MQEPVAFRCNGTPHFVLSFFCPIPMMGLLSAKTGVLDYWLMVVPSTCCPLCMMLWLLSGSDFKKRLGGKKDDCMDACCISCCCLPCSLARNAQALDAATGSELGCFSVKPGEEASI